MRQFLSKEQALHQLRKYRVGSSLPMSPPDNSEGYASGDFENTPGDIILDIANDLDYFDIRVIMSPIAPTWAQCVTLMA
jgi:hypothetical protein